MARHALAVSQSREAKAREEMLSLLASGDWSRADAYSLLALYKWCHAQVYAIEASDVVGQEFGIAAQVAKAFASREFANDYNETVVFIRWTWKREQEREKWRRENGKQGGRLSWRVQFSNTLLIDYRLYLAREATKG